MVGARNRRAQVLDAAVTVLAEHGLRGLSHRRVDTVAGAPSGTTSNHFRNRDALVVAVVRRINEWIDESGALAGDVTGLNAEDAVFELFRQHVVHGVGSWRREVLAWNRIVFELPAMPGINDVIVEIRNGGIKAYSSLLQDCGSADPERQARLIMALYKGIHLRHYLVPDPDVDPERALRPLFDGLLRGRGSVGSVRPSPAATPPEPPLEPPSAGAGRKEQVLAAAVGVLADKGTRGLTHGAVDRAAGVPAGTTSNHFRTRSALLEGVVRQLNRRFVAAVEASTAHPPRDAADLVARMVGGVTTATDPEQPGGVAFIMLSYEAASNADIAALVTEAVLRVDGMVTGWFEGLGSATPRADAVLLGQYMRGLIVNQRTLADPEFDAAAALTPMVDGLLRRSRPRP